VNQAKRSERIVILKKITLAKLIIPKLVNSGAKRTGLFKNLTISKRSEEILFIFKRKKTEF
jgi:hypothetical protein